MTPTHRRQRRRPAAFTLLEVVISLVVIGVLVATMSSAIVLATKALPTDDTDAGSIVSAAQVMQQFRDDLQQAIHLTERDPNAVTAVLPDQDGDGAPEVIRWAWAGSAADPLTRQRNGGAPVIVIKEVETLTLGYAAVDRSAVFPGTPVESAEELLSSQDGGTGTGSEKLKSSAWFGTRVDPNLPADATGWRITRATFYGDKQGGSGSTITVELRDWDSDAPGNTVFDSMDRPESDLTAWDWYDFSFDGSPTFDASEDAFINLANYGGGDAGKWEYDKGNSAPTNMYESGDEGAAWTAYADDEELKHYVYGIYTAPGDGWSYTRQRVKCVDLSLALTRNPSRTLDTMVALPNAPVAVDDLWVTDFGSDPTRLDLDANGVADWSGSFNDSRMMNGHWAIQAGHQLEPDDTAFDTPTVLNVRLRDITDDGAGAGVRWRCDRGDGLQTVITAELELDGGEQVLTVQGLDDGGTLTTWFTATTDDTDAWVHLRLLLDPDNDRAGVEINQLRVGAFVYGTTADNGSPSLGFFADSANAGVQCDHVAVAVAGTTAVEADATINGATAGASIDLDDDDGGLGLGNTAGTSSADSSGTSSSSTSSSTSSSSSWWGSLFN